MRFFAFHKKVANIIKNKKSIYYGKINETQFYRNGSSRVVGSFCRNVFGLQRCSRRIRNKIGASFAEKI